MKRIEKISLKLFEIFIIHLLIENSISEKQVQRNGS